MNPPSQAVGRSEFGKDRNWQAGDAIAEIAARRGLLRIVERCDASNGPMKSLLRAFEVPRLVQALATGMLVAT